MKNNIEKEIIPKINKIQKLQTTSLAILECQKKKINSRFHKVANKKLFL